MSGAVAQAAKLDNLLLAQDEEEYERIAVEFTQQLSKLPEDDVGSLEDLDPATQTILFLFNLSKQIDASIKSGKAANKQLPASVLPEGRLWAPITNVLLSFDPIQVRYAGHLLLKIVDIVARGAEQTTDYIPAIQLLETTILKLDPSSSTLTSTHHAYVRLCLLAHAYAQAVTILDRPISSIPSSEVSKQIGTRAGKYICSVQESSATYLTTANRLTQKVTSRMYLEYFLFGSMCYMAVGAYKQALLFLEIVLTSPATTNAASFVQLEAFKKWSLVSLLMKGYPGEPHKAIAPTTLRNLRAAAKPYECIVEAFKSGKLERLQQEIQEGLQIWQEDENYGLIHEVFVAFRKHAILNLAKTYAALPVEEVTRLASPDTTDVGAMVTHIQSLIESGELQAELVTSSDGKSITLRFASEQTFPIPEHQVEQEMITRTQELQLLLRNVSSIDHQMEIHRDYIEYLQKLRNARDRAKKNDTSANRGVGMDIHDEDMMEDL